MRPWALVVTVFLGCALCGCAGRRCTHSHYDAAAPPECGEPVIVDRRGTLEPDVPALGPLDPQIGELGTPENHAEYRVLRADDVQCCAAARAPVANALGRERSLAVADACGSGEEDRGARVKTQALEISEVGLRNRTAARALEAFYLLAEAEAHGDLLRESLNEVRQMLENLDRLKAQGIRTEADPDEIHRQQIGLIDRAAQLELTLRQLNGRLLELTGDDATGAARIWPAADLAVTNGPIDVEEAVARGLALRADVGLVRMLCRSLDRETLDAVRTAMSQVNVALGTVSTASAILTPRRNAAGEADEVHRRRQQLSELLDSYERAAAQEIRYAADAVRTRLARITLAQAAVDSWQHQLASLRLRRETSPEVTPIDVITAKLGLIEARSELTHQVIAWQIARVRLKEAQGQLACECGYELPEPCWGACGCE